MRVNSSGAREMRSVAIFGALHLVVGLFIAFSNSALAADPALIVGKWIEKFPNGAGMVTEFSPSTISSYPVDPSGKVISAGNRMNVTYRDLDQSSIGIDFQGGGGIMVIVKSPDAIVLDFPGAGAHQLTRVQP